MYYTNALTQHLLESSENSAIAKLIRTTGKEIPTVPFTYDYTYPSEEDRKDLTDATITIPLAKGTDMMNMMMGGMTGYNPYSVSLNRVGGTDVPMTFEMYPVDFKTKDKITDWLDKWNDACESESGILSYTAADGTEKTITGLDESKVIKYTDTVGLIIFMVDTMIDMITIALIAFTALSLVVSTVMVGIITYVSVVERIKEIGILRSVGARKKDIKRLFNAETFIIGACRRRRRNSGDVSIIAYSKYNRRFDCRRLYDCGFAGMAGVYNDRHKRGAHAYIGAYPCGKRG